MYGTAERFRPEAGGRNLSPRAENRDSAVVSCFENNVCAVHVVLCGLDGQEVGLICLAHCLGSLSSLVRSS